MVTAFLAKPGEIELRDMPLPEPAEGEVLIKIKAALTCGTDLKAFVRGHDLIPMPGPFGHEYSGIVIEKGKGVAKVRVGDAVMGVHSAPCMECPYCRRSLFNLCDSVMSSKVLGAFSEYMVLPKHVVATNLFKKPDGLGFIEAAFLEPLACVVHGMDSLDIRKGETVFVIGAGPIGLLHLLLAKSRGARVLVTGLEEERLQMAKKFGADLVVSPAQAGKAVREFTGIGADYVFECTGQPHIWEASVDFVRKGGTVVLFGGCKSGTIVAYKADRLHYDEITIKGTFHFTPDDVKKAFSILRHGKINVKKLITATYPLKEIHTAFARLAKGDGIKYAIIP